MYSPNPICAKVLKEVDAVRTEATLRSPNRVDSWLLRGRWFAANLDDIGVSRNDAEHDVSRHFSSKRVGRQRSTTLGNAAIRDAVAVFS